MFVFSSYVITINVLTSQDFEGIFPYFRLYCAIDKHT